MAGLAAECGSISGKRGHDRIKRMEVNKWLYGD